MADIPGLALLPPALRWCFARPLILLLLRVDLTHAKLGGGLAPSRRSMTPTVRIGYHPLPGLISFLLEFGLRCCC